MNIGPLRVAFRNHDVGGATIEVCDIFHPDKPDVVSTFPAAESEPEATRNAGKRVTYAEAYGHQYAEFKRGSEPKPVKAKRGRKAR